MKCVAPYRKMRIVESRKVLLVELSSGNPEYLERLESRIKVALTRMPESWILNPESSTWNPESIEWIQNPRLSWITIERLSWLWYYLNTIYVPDLLPILPLIIKTNLHKMIITSTQNTYQFLALCKFPFLAPFRLVFQSAFNFCPI